MKMLTTKQALELLAGRGIVVSYPTVAQWVRDGRFEDAEREETERGPVWRIPIESVKRFTPPQTGRPKATVKPSASGKRATGQKRASKGRSTGKKKGGKR